MKPPADSAGDRNSTATKANRPSLLLTNDENDQLFRLLGRRCQTLSTAVVQLYTTQSPAHASWVKRCTGALCFIKDNLRKSYYFRLYCLKANQMVWEQELYEKIEVTHPRPYLITFEGQDGIVAFNFANEDEADGIMSTTYTTIHNRNRRRDERIKRNNTRKEPPPARPPPLQTFGGGSTGVASSGPGNDLDMGVTYRNKQPFSGPFAAGPAFQQPPVQALGGNHQQHQKPRKVRGMGKLQKSDIGSPSNFKHVTHVGWDPHSGFDLIGGQDTLKPFLEKAGVGDQHLKDRDTCAFIYDFIQTNNVLDTVKSEQSSGRKQKPPAPPPVPVRTSCSTAAPPPETSPPAHQTHDSPRHPTTQQHPPAVGSQAQNGQRNPPPPPPHRTLPPLPPTTPPKVGNVAPAAPRPPPMQPPPSSSAPAPPPPPPMPAGPMPPPPPPMMMPSLKPPAPAIPGGGGPSGGSGDGEGGDARSALLDSIRKGTTLKKVDQSAHSTGSGGSGDMRNDLMTEIQQGFQLRPVANRELNAVGDRNSGGGSGDVGTDALADALRRALAERGRVIRPSDEDDSDSNSNNTDWED